LNSLESRIAKLEEAINALRKRVAKVEGVLEQIDKRLNHMESELRELRRGFNTRFYWLMGVLITMWITIIVAVLLKPS
jgi:uncharacterized coiled-coil protein SlyX